MTPRTSSGDLNLNGMYYDMTPYWPQYAFGQSHTPTTRQRWNIDPCWPETGITINHDGQYADDRPQQTPLFLWITVWTLTFFLPDSDVNCIADPLFSIAARLTSPRASYYYRWRPGLRCTPTIANSRRESETARWHDKRPTWELILTSAFNHIDQCIVTSVIIVSPYK